MAAYKFSKQQFARNLVLSYEDFMIRFLRWTIFLPVALIAGYLAYLVGGFLNNASFAMFTGPINDTSKYFLLEPMAHMYLGVVTVYAAVKTAPQYPKSIAVLLCALLIFVSGASAYSALLVAEYTVFPSMAGLLFGACAALIAAVRGEIEPA